jgi:hypothetical protein
LLHPRRQVRGPPHGRVVHVDITANGSHDDLARVEPDLDLDVRAVLVACLPSILPHQLLHLERRQAGPDGMVLVGQRRPEQRHDPVAHHLVHRALVAPDGFHHALEDRVEELAGVFGIAVGEQLHRPLQIGKEHGDLLPLALQRARRREDALGDVRGPPVLGNGNRQGTAAENFLVERFCLLLWLCPEFPLERGQAELILAQRRAASSGFCVELHQHAVRGLLERIQRKKPQRGLDGRLGRACRALMGEQPGQSPERHFVQPLALAEEPIFEGWLLDREPFQQVAPIESGRVGERGRSPLGHPLLELADVDRHGAGIEGYRTTVRVEGLTVGAPQALSQRVECLTQAHPRRGLHRAPPEETGQLVSGMVVAGAALPDRLRVLAPSVWARQGRRRSPGGLESRPGGSE